ncbi:hypothetical protein P792_03775 [Asaia sp. SF2.1]|nr:hypothetical protein P792_03775 [Asaia sp. SF2.1]
MRDIRLTTVDIGCERREHDAPDAGVKQPIEL